MKYLTGSILLVIVIFCNCNQSRSNQDLPIIDMHIHCYDEKSLYKDAKDYYGNPGSENIDIHFNQTYESLQKFNIVKAVISGTLKSVLAWKKKDADDRFIKGILMFAPGEQKIDSLKFEQLVRDGTIEIFGEIGAYYSGTTLSDEAWQPYLRICERYEIPVAVHTGGGDPGGTYGTFPNARLSLGDPYLIEDVLVRYPKLRIYIMHSGEDWHEHALRLMAYYPHLYSDLGAMLWVEPLTLRYVKDFLKNAKQAGYLNRVMFGSDQMVWPKAIEMSIDYLNSLDFLTESDKRDIFYNNAARFLRLKEPMDLN
ncbi:hypothetical protein BVY01_03625 [bacterium I07]|nr:hypothetical protein BVY01_03625 [bacterium I07]